MRWSRNPDSDAPPSGIPEERLVELEAENTRLFAELGKVQDRFMSLARGVWRVQEDERRRLAQELHDQLGQALTALIHRLEQLPADQRQECLSLARQTLEDVRELSRLLRPPVLDDLGLVPALKWLARRTRESVGLPVVVSAPESMDPLDEESETLIFRLTQESLNNAIKHADANRVEIHLSRAGNQIDLRIRDDGKGFDPDSIADSIADTAERGMGLAGMRDRLALFGGKIAISSAPGHGTTISATLALPVARKQR